MKKYIPFTSFLVINFLVLYLFSVIFPNNIVFGNDVLSSIFAAIWTAFILTFLSWIAKPILSRIRINLTGVRNKIIFYFIVNTVLIWILARFPSFTGFGISRFSWAIILGLFLELTQWRIWEILRTRKLT